MTQLKKQTHVIQQTCDSGIDVVLELKKAFDKSLIISGQP